MKTHARVLPVLISAILIAAIGSGVPAAFAQGILPAPVNIAVSDGDQPGAIEISWDPVQAATHYRIGWIALEDYESYRDAERDWLEAFTYKDVGRNSDNPQLLTRLTPGIPYAFIIGSNASRNGAPAWSEWQWFILATDPTPTDPFDFPVPSPRTLSGEPGPDTSQVTLRWRAASGAVMHMVWSHRFDGSDNGWHEGGSDSVVVDGLEAGVDYHFSVIAGHRNVENGSIRWSVPSDRISVVALSSPAPVETADTTIIAAGGKHTCLLNTDGRVECWGANGEADQGQADPPDGEFTSISAGYEHTCGILASKRTAVCWGDDSVGQSSPQSGHFTAIDSGRAHTCALLDDGTVKCWGSNEYGQLNTPSGAFIAVSAGGAHSCGLRENGRVECWGDDFHLQSTPPDASFYSVSAGRWHTCGVKKDGNIACWGANPDGQAPVNVDGSYRSVSSGGRHTCALADDWEFNCWGTYNAFAYGGDNSFVLVSAGEEHTCLLKSDDMVSCSGSNHYGQSAPPSSDTFVSVNTGHWHTCGVRTDSTVVCWGRGWGDNGAPPDTAFQSVSVGFYHACGVRTDGAVVCWGNNERGQAFPPRGTFQSASAAGSGHTCGVRTDGTVVCWGQTYEAPPGGAFVAISSFGGENVIGGRICGLRPDNSVVCWSAGFGADVISVEGSFQSISASNSLGCGVQLDGTVSCWAARADPPEGLFKSVSVGGEHICGLRRDDTIECWGDDSYGQTTSPKGSFQSVSSGGYHTCAVRSDTRVVCWGFNRHGLSVPP